MAAKIELVVNRVQTQEALRQRMVGLRSAARERFAYQPDVLEAIDQLIELGNEIIDFAHQYDFRNVPYNGYRSLLNLVCNLVQRGLELTETGHHDLAVLTDLSRAARQFASGIDHIRKLRSDTKDAAGSCYDQRCPLQTSDAKFGVECFFKFLDNHDSEPFYGPLVDFSSTDPVGQKTIRWAVGVITSFAQHSYSDFRRCWKDTKFRAAVYARLIKNVDIYYIKYLDAKFAQNYLSEQLVPLLFHGLAPQIRRTLFIDRQYKWQLICNRMEQTAEVIDNGGGQTPNPGSSQQKQVRCRYLLEPDTSGHLSEQGLLLFNCHGGGYATSSSESHEIYLREWAKKVAGLAILSVDMSLAPEAIFPVPVQEILDVYLWVTSGDPSVKEKLGFQPQKIVLNGDSSGSCIALVLLNILNDIRVKDPDAIRMMPMAHVGIYSSFTSDPFIYPSMFMAASHWILTPCVFTSFMEKYIPHNFTYKQRTNHDQYWTDKSQSSLSKWYRALRWIFGLNDVGSQDQAIPWYKANDPKAIQNYLVNDMKLNQHPYISPILYPDLYCYKDIKLYLVACEMDPILDHSVIMARKWRGPVWLDVVEDLTHGYLFYISFGGIYQQGSDLILKRIKQAFGLIEDEPGMITQEKFKRGDA